MKARTVIYVASVIGVAATFSYYRHASDSGRQRINCVSNRTQIGLAFRMSHNDFGGQFSITGPMAPDSPAR